MTPHTPLKLRLGLTLSAIVIVAFFGFLLLAATAPSLLMQPVAGAVPLSFLLAAALIVGVIALTGLYVLRANAAERAP
jgi:uncharacterized membrane protein (DUF485 family)